MTGLAPQRSEGACPACAQERRPGLAPQRSEGACPACAQERRPGLAPQRSEGACPACAQELRPGLAPQRSEGACPACAQERRPGLAPQRSEGACPACAQELRSVQPAPRPGTTRAGGSGTASRSQPLQPLPLVLTACLLALAACKTAEPTTDASHRPTSAAPTPEVPYQPKTAAAGQTAAPANGQPARLPSPPRQATTDAGARDAFKAGVEAAQRGDSAQAESQFRRALDRDSKLDYAWTNLGIIYERQNKLQDAERAYRRALELRPDEDAAWDYLTKLECRQGRAAQIEGELRGRIQQFPSSLGLRNALVFVLVFEGKDELAATEAKKVLKADERNVRAMQLLAQVYYREQKLELAKMVLENARAIDPNDAATHNGLGLVSLSLKNRNQALEEFRQAATLKPDYAEATNNYGALLTDSQDFENAIKELELAVAAEPDFVDARLNLGNAYRGHQELDKALAQYNQVLRLKPQLADTYFNLAILHLDSELPNQDTLARLKQSIAYFDQYRQHGGKDERVEQYLKDANKGIDRETRRRDREKRDQLKKAQQPQAAPPAAAPASGTKTSPGSSPVAPASRLSDDNPAPKKARTTTKPVGSGKLGGDEK